MGGARTKCSRNTCATGAHKTLSRGNYSRRGLDLGACCRRRRMHSFGRNTSRRLDTVILDPHFDRPAGPIRFYLRPASSRAAGVIRTSSIRPEA